MATDLSGKNLQGQSFRNQDLTEANFSHADIRGTDFTNATLVGADFSYAKAGLQRFWAIGLSLVSLGLSALSGFAAAFAGAFPAYFLATEAINQYTILPGVMVLALVMVFLITALLRGLATALTLTAVTGIFVVAVVVVMVRTEVIIAAFTKATEIALVLVSVLIVVSFGVESVAGLGAMFVSLFFVLAGVGAVAFVVSGFIAGSNSPSMGFALAVGGAVAGAGAFTVAAVVGSAVSFAGAIAGIFAVIEIVPWAEIIVQTATGLFTVTIAIMMAGAMAGPLGGAIAGGIAFLGIYIGWRTLVGDPKFQLVRGIFLPLANVGGTSFRSANLTRAKFVYAKLPCTDFSKAVLAGSLWQASQISQAHFDQLPPESGS